MCEGMCHRDTGVPPGITAYVVQRLRSLIRNSRLGAPALEARLQLADAIQRSTQTCPLLQRAGAGITGPKTTCFREPAVDKGRLVIRRLTGCSQRGFYFVRGTEDLPASPGHTTRINR